MRKIIMICVVLVLACSSDDSYYEGHIGLHHCASENEELCVALDDTCYFLNYSEYIDCGENDKCLQGDLYCAELPNVGGMGGELRER